MNTSSFSADAYNPSEICSDGLFSGLSAGFASFEPNEYNNSIKDNEASIEDDLSDFRPSSNDNVVNRWNEDEWQLESTSARVDALFHSFLPNRIDFKSQLQVYACPIAVNAFHYLNDQNGFRASSIIAQGSYAVVREIFFTHIQQAYVIKYAKYSPKYRTLTNSFLMADYNTHMMVTGGKKLWGIQSPPKRVLKLVLGEEKYARLGFIYSKYISDFNPSNPVEQSDVLELNFHQIYLVMEQLLHTLVFFEERQIVDIDRKLENTLYDTLDVGGVSFPLAHFSDFGGTSFLSDWQRKPDLITSKQCYWPAEYEEFLDLPYDSNSDYVKQKALKLPIFAYGVMLYVLLTKSYPFSMDENHHFFGDYIEINDEAIPTAIKEMVRLMLDPSKERTGAEIKQRFDAFLNEKHPDLVELIQQAKTHFAAM